MAVSKVVSCFQEKSTSTDDWKELKELYETVIVGCRGRIKMVFEP
jgi:hypothetical protein